VRRFLPFALTAVLVLPALPALAGPIDSAVNGSRSDWLPSRAELDAKAHSSASSQAAKLQIAHTSLGGLGDICSSAGEIVGMGPSVAVIFDLFLKSSHHREILLSPVWTAIGTGAVTGSDGNLYVSVVFCKEANPTPSTQPSATPVSTATTAPARATVPKPAVIAPAVSLSSLNEVFFLLLLGELDDLWLTSADSEHWWPRVGPSPFLPLAQWLAPSDRMLT
jgi:hypothetical protein